VPVRRAPAGIPSPLHGERVRGRGENALQRPSGAATDHRPKRRCNKGPADCQSATQQTVSLRYVSAGAQHGLWQPRFATLLYRQLQAGSASGCPQRLRMRNPGLARARSLGPAGLALAGLGGTPFAVVQAAQVSRLPVSATGRHALQMLPPTHVAGYVFNPSPNTAKARSARAHLHKRAWQTVPSRYSGARNAGPADGPGKTGTETTQTMKLLALLTVAISLVLVGCGEKQSEETKTPPATTNAPAK